MFSITIRMALNSPKLPSYIIRRIYVSTELNSIQRMYHCNNMSCICCSIISCDVHRSRKWIHEDWYRQTRSAYGNSTKHVSQYCMSNFLPNILMLSPLENNLSTVSRLIDTVSRLIDTVSRLIDTVSRLIDRVSRLIENLALSWSIFVNSSRIKVIWTKDLHLQNSYNDQCYCMKRVFECSMRYQWLF